MQALNIFDPMKHCAKFILTVLLVLFSQLAADAARKKKQSVDTVGISHRGVMESFANVTDGVESRLGFYRSIGLTHYFYCPSDDRYCNRWGWRFLYNDADRHALRRLNTLCRDAGLEFVWTVNPGERYNWMKDDYKFLLDKLIMMYYNGIRSFAVDFTDNPGDYAAVRDSLVRNFVATREEKVSLFIIDDVAEVVYPSQGTSSVESLMRGYHFDNEFISRARKSETMICNVSSSDEFAKLAVIAVADCARNPEEYSPDRSMADAVNVLDDDVREAFVTFLSHTGSVNESSSVEVFSLADWSGLKADALRREFDRIEKVPVRMAESTDSEVVNALMPWFAEFGRLGTRGKKVLDCMEYYHTGDLGRFWITYLSTVMSGDERISYERYPVGAGKLHPFCVKAMQEMKEAFSSMLSGQTELHNLASTLYAEPNEALDSDFDTGVVTEGHMEFAIPAQAQTCHLLTGPLPEDEHVLFRQLATDGSLVAEFVIRSPFNTYDIKEGAVKVDVLGNVEIYETIFVDLQP